MGFRHCWRSAGVSLIILTSFCGELGAQIARNDLPAAQALRDRIAAPSPSVRADEAQRVAECAYAAATQLRRDYGVIGGPPSFHNFLVNLGIRKRGLCFQWAEDLLVQLDALKLRTLELHWAEAWAGSWREHNCVVVTTKGQPFREGIILDCWRHAVICSGRRLSLTIIHGSKTGIMPPSCAVNSQRPKSPGLRIYGTQTLGRCAPQVCDLRSIADRRAGV
jgi:hypothetical protein